MEGPTVNINKSVSEQIFDTFGEKIKINGSCNLVGFNDSKSATVNGSTTSNFKNVKTVVVNGSVTGCVFDECSSVKVNGPATDCVFLNMQRDQIRVNGTIRNCMIDGESLAALPKFAEKVFAPSLDSIRRTGGGTVILGGINVRGGGVISYGDVVTYADDEADVSVGEISVSEGGAFSLFGTSNGSTGTVSISKYKTNDQSWSNLRIHGGSQITKDYLEIKKGGGGTVNGITVDAGRYRMRNGTMYRQNLTDDPLNNNSWIRVPTEGIKSINHSVF